MTPSPLYSRHMVRKLLSALLPGDPEFDALCCDHFPAIKTLFSAGMDRLTKETLLLERVKLVEIISALKLDAPAAFQDVAHLISPTEAARPAIIAQHSLPTMQLAGTRQRREHPDKYDVFLHAAQAPEDRRWVVEFLRPALVQRGLSVLDDSEFHLGMPYIRALEDAVQKCQYTVLILSAAYVEQGFAQLGDLLAQHLATEEKRYRMIGVLREPCSPRLGIRLAMWIDLSEAAHQNEGLDRLAAALHRDPPGAGSL